MTPIDAAYLAGVVDGEGSIIIAKITKKNEGRVYNPTYSPILVVSNTSPALIDWCVSRGAVLRKTKHRAGSWPFRKPAYKAVWSTRKAVEALRLIEPFLVIKRRQAQLAIELGEMNATEPRRTRTKKELFAREKIKLEVQRLNGKKI